MRNGEIRWFDNSRLVLSWIRPGVLSVELWRPGHLKDGHGWWLAGSTILDSKQLREVVALVLGPRDCAGYEATGAQ
jgi:hypothetical protein